MRIPIVSLSVGNPFMEPLRTLKSPDVHPWGRLLSSAPASLSRASSSPDLSPPHLSTECLEADAAAVVTSLEEESACHVFSRSSLGTRISSTTSSSSTSSASPTKCLAYSVIDVET